MRRYAFAPLLLLLAAVAQAQSKPTLQPADYGRWENLGSSELSPDGRWLAYEIRRVDEDIELQVRELATDSVRLIRHARAAAFSADSRWLAYLVGVSKAEQDRATPQRPVETKLELVDLRTGSVTVRRGVGSFAFSGDGKYLAWRAAGGGGGGGGASASEPRGAGAPAAPRSRGADLVVRDLATGLDTNFGNVAEYAWQEEGSLLAMTVDATGRHGNGVRVYAATTGTVRTLDSDTASYVGLAWRRRSDDVAVLKLRPSPEHADSTHDVLAWRGLASSRPRASRLDALAHSGIPADTRITRARALQWSDDGATIFLPLQPMERRKEREKADSSGYTAAVGSEGADEAAGAGASRDSAAKAAWQPPRSDTAGVEVWHARDVDIMPTQKVQANQDRNRHLMAAWHLAGDRLVQLSSSPVEAITLAAGQKVAMAADGAPYDRERMFGPAYRDLYAVDVTTGERTKVADRIEFSNGPSATGRYLLYLKENHWYVYDRRTRRETNLTAKLGTGFINFKDDHTVVQKPPYGVAGWMKDDSAVLLYDEFDIWSVRPDGSGGRKLTDGAADGIRHRRVVLDPELDRFVDPSRPLYVALYGTKSKKYGYGLVRRGGGVERLVYLDKNVVGLEKAKDADRYQYRVQAFDDSPDVFVGGPRLADARQATKTNPFAGEYAWSPKSELIEYVNAAGDTLQAALHYPANWEAGKKYPMVVYYYEITSNQIHNWTAPSEITPYNMTVFTQDGYFVLRPDITYRPRNPGLSAVEALLPAVDRAVATGMVDAERVGIVGHSWGGYQTTFVVTQTNRFRAAVAGAPLTDLISMYLSIYWNSGGTDARIFEISQGRMEVPPWEDLDAYMRNSALFNIKTLDTPLLMTFGTEDGAVDWHQGIELYNAARRENKPLVMLVYEGENHSLARRPNQYDYHRRIRQWFAHYLKDEPAPEWITGGVKFLDREKELKEARKQGR